MILSPGGCGKEKKREDTEMYQAALAVRYGHDEVSRVEAELR